MANYIDKEALLRDKRVIAEIDRHLWIESEKAGEDIGFERAKEDWINNFSKAWMSYHMPDMIIKEMKNSMEKEIKRMQEKKLPLRKRRSAKSYLK